VGNPESVTGVEAGRAIDAEIVSRITTGVYPVCQYGVEVTVGKKGVTGEKGLTSLFICPTSPPS
jgi:hypothetical protein